MRAWRIACEAHALDRTGAAGATGNGRWHGAGHPVIYAACSVELCVLEAIVLCAGARPSDLMLVELTLPDDDALYERCALANRPRWRTIPPSTDSIDLGRDFLRAGRALALHVPSALVPEATQLLINPEHPRFEQVGMRILRPFDLGLFDPTSASVSDGLHDSAR